MNRDPELPRCVVCDTRLRIDENPVCDKCASKCPECGVRMDDVPFGPCATHEKANADEPMAPAPDHLMDLHLRVATIIRKAYFIHTRNERLAHETAVAVLEEVTRTYEQAVAGAAEQGATIT